MISDESNSFRPAGQGRRAEGHFEWPATPALLTVIIPVYRDAEGLAVTLDSLHTQTLPRTAFEVLVANDGADAAVTAVCREREVREIALPVNRGSYAARNAALAQARGEFIGFADADVRIDPRWCETGRAALGGADLVAGRTVIDLSRERSTVTLFQYCFAFPAKSYVTASGMAQTVNLFVRRTVFEEVGFFDDRLRSGGDLEWTLRATREGGKRLAYEEGAVVSHPPRNYRQLLASSERMLYGQENGKLLHRDNGELLRGTARNPLKNLLPPAPRSMRRMREAGLSSGEFVRVYFFAWWLKARTLLMIPRVRRRIRTATVSRAPMEACP